MDRTSGEIVWKHSVQDQIRCSPTVVDDRAFLAGCDGQLHIVDLTQGEDAAGVPIDAPTGSTPAVLGNLVFFGTEGGTFYAVNWETAEIAWTFRDEDSAQPFRSSAAVHANTVVVGSRNKKLHAFAADTGETLWTFSARQRIDSSPVIVGDRVFFGVADGRLYAVQLSTGEQLWEYEAGGGFAGSAAVAEQRLVIASDDGIVYCFGKRPS